MVIWQVPQKTNKSFSSTPLHQNLPRIYIRSLKLVTADEQTHSTTYYRSYNANITHILPANNKNNIQLSSTLSISSEKKTKRQTRKREKLET